MFTNSMIKQLFCSPRCSPLSQTVRPRLSWKTLYILGKIVKEEGSLATDALIPYLEHDDADTRSEALEAVGALTRVGDPSFFAVVATAQERKDVDFRCMLMRTLQRSRYGLVSHGEMDFTWLSQLSMHKRSNVRSTAAQVLQFCFRDDIRGANYLLIILLSEKCAIVRRAAVHALGHLIDFSDATVISLCKCMHDINAKVRRLALRSLERILYALRHIPMQHDWALAHLKSGIQHCLKDVSHDVKQAAWSLSRCV